MVNADKVKGAVKYEKLKAGHAVPYPCEITPILVAIYSKWNLKNLVNKCATYGIVPLMRKYDEMISLQSFNENYK